MGTKNLLDQVTGRSLLFRLYGWFEKLRINSIDFQKRPPILIYQMGKVGSTSITEALQQSSLSNPVFPPLPSVICEKGMLLSSNLISLPGGCPVFIGLYIESLNIFASYWFAGKYN